ncbi:MAG: hypothetical protein ABI165_20645 [Bryobacteraceae bacterium]
MIRSALLSVFCAALPLAAQRPPVPSVRPTPRETRQIQTKIDALAAIVRDLKSRRINDDLIADVEVYEKAGRFLLEFPEDFFTQDGINHALSVLDTGLERAHQLQSGESPWTSGVRQTHGFYSALDGSVEPYGITLPASYDPARPTRLYVWLHGRSNNLTESQFLYAFPNHGPSKPPVADAGQIQLDVYGRWNGAGYHFAGETGVFEAIASVQKRFKIDPQRILLRGFSMGGEGAWNLALHNPDRWAAAEIGAGTWSRRAQMPGLPPYQQATLRIWENMSDWALNVFNLPLAGHDGDSDTQVCCLPPPPRGTPSRGQLESSIHVREQLAKEGFPSVGEPDDLSARGIPAIFLISQHTGHGTSPEVREKLDAFLKKYGDRGQISPDHIRFVTYTTRYNRDYWVTLDQLEHQYDRVEIDAERADSGRQYHIITKNLTRLILRETGHAASIQIDNRTLRVKPASEIVLDKSPAGWRQARSEKRAGLHKIHALQGPIDDAFLDPFLLVRPTGVPWNAAVNQQTLRALARFDQLYAHFLRAHPRMIDDKNLTPSDFAKYNVVLFGDPGSNRWIAKLQGRLPVRWTRTTVTFSGHDYAASEYYPALIYPNPLSPSHYIVLNSGLTIDDREYRGDYGLPRLGDFAILKVKEGSDIPDVAQAGLFDESWHLPK